MHSRKFLFIFFFTLLFFAFGNLRAQENYERLKNKYENYNKNDEAALPYVTSYIKKAKQEHNYSELKQAYEDYSYYSLSKKAKIKYADSAIVAAKKTEDNDLLSSAYLYKGSLYYFYDKDYQSALNEYLIAYEYSKNGNDDYLKYKVIYQMGLVKSYLGYYNEAIEHFQECISFFEPRMKGNHHPNIIYNSTKGYLNSLHQIAVCYRNIKNYQKADSIVDRGLAFPKIEEFSTEKAYLIKCKGISEYHHKNYNLAITLLQKSLPVLNKNNDFYWSSVADFYIGKSYLGLGKENFAIQQFEKVDSIFQERQFIVPELLENYNLLIKYYQNNKASEKELEYLNKLLKADSILAKDFKSLSAKIHKDYDKQILVEAKNRLEKQSHWSLGAILSLIIVVGGLIFIIWKLYKKEKEIREKYTKLERKIQNHLKSTPVVSYENIPQQSKAVISKEIFTDLEEKLNQFENSKNFKEKGINLPQLAENLKTNTTYLSQYINDVMGMNFNKYVATLRINYITELMYNDAQVLGYSVQGLADQCGISSRQNFSDLFLEINGIRPTDFIKQRKKELAQEGNVLGITTES